MGFWDDVTSKLGKANETLSSASKQWRDEDLAEREDELSRRERRVKKRQELTKGRLKEVRELEARQSRRKWLYWLSALAGAVPAFFLGISMGTWSGEVKPANRPSTSAEAQTGKTIEQHLEPRRPPKKVARIKYADPYAALDEGKYGRGNNTNVGYYCLDVEATGDATFDECIGAVALVLAGQR